MNKKIIGSLALGATLLTNLAGVIPVSAKQQIVSPGDTGSTDVTITVEPTYTVSIPQEVKTDVPFSVTKSERELVSFEVGAKDVVLPYNHAVQVSVQTAEEYQNAGKNAAKNETGQFLNYWFNRDEEAEYGLKEEFNDGDASGHWVAAQFRPITDDLYTDLIPVSMMTDDVLVTSGVYNSTLLFDIEVVEAK